MHKKQITYIFLVIGLIGLVAGLGTIKTTPPSSVVLPQVPDTAELSNSTITYTPEVERVVDLFRVSVNLSSPPYNLATKVNMTITYSNATAETYNLTEASDVWTFSKYFDYQAPVGTQSFKLFIYQNTVLLEDSYDQPFEIKNNHPKFTISLSNSSVYRNGTIFFNVTPMDIETPFQNLSWSWQILFGAVVMNSSAGNPKLTGLSHYFPSSTTDSRLGTYSIKGTINDDEDVTITYANFTLLNNAPTVSEYNITYPNILYPNRILRQTESFHLEVNVSDVEVDSPDIDLRIRLEGPEGIKVDKSGSMVRSSPWNFVGNISLAKTYPIGEYTCYIEAYELVTLIEDNTSRSFTFTLGNNAPDAANISYTINDNIPTSSGIRIKEFEQITFAVNVSSVDVEGIEIIRIHLISPTGIEYIYPLSNTGQNYIEYTLSAKDLEYGQWITWIYVVDSNGVEVHASVPYSFDILPDRFNQVLPWIMLVVGLVLSFGITAAVLGTRYISLRRNFDNLLSRTGEYKKPEPSPKPDTTPKSTLAEKSGTEPSTSTKKKKSVTKKHELFRKIKKK